MLTTDRIDKFNYSDNFTKELKAAIARTLKPPSNLNIVEWAEKHFVLSSDDSAEPGKYRVSRAPYQREILEAIGDPMNQEVVLMTGAQVGKTLIQLISLGYYADQCPSPIMLVLPDVGFGEDFSKRRLAPMIRNSPKLKEVFKNNDTGTNNTILSKFFPGGSIFIASAGIPSDLTSRPVRVILADELDKFPSSTGEAGDPVALAKQRTATFTHNRKIILTSTPLLKGNSRIETSYDNSSQATYEHRCIHCDELFAPEWEYVHWTTIENEPKPHTALLYCPHCGAGHNDSERQRAVDRGSWNIRYPDRKVKGFFINALSSPWTRLEELVEEFLTASINNNLLKQFINEKLGKSYEAIGERIDNIEFDTRLEDYSKDSLSNEILFLTAGVDTQADRVEGVVLGWGKDFECWVVDYFAIQGAPNDPLTWRTLHEELQQPYTRNDGVKLKLLKTGIDSGGNTSEVGGFSAYVKKFCKDHAQFSYLPFKGASTSQKSIFPENKRKAGQVYLIDTGQAKEMLFGWLKKDKPGPGYIHFYNGLDTEFFNQLTSEEFVKERLKNGRIKTYWKGIDSKRHEVLDCSVYALAARLSLQNGIEKSQTSINQRKFEKLEEIKVSPKEEVKEQILIPEKPINKQTTEVASELPPKLRRMNPRYRQQYTI